MAAKKTATAYNQSTAPYSDRDYQCEEDVRTLQRTAEVMADMGRRRKALGKFRKQQAGGQRMIDILSGHRLKRS